MSFLEEIRKIKKEYKKQRKIDMEIIEDEMLEYEKRHNRFLEKDKTLKLTPGEILLWKICPNFFKILIILICIAVGILGGIYYLLITIVISCIIGCLFFKIF